MSAVLKLIARDENVHPVFRAAIVPQPVQSIRARLGLRPTFQSQGDADAYDRGWQLRMQGEPIPDQIHTPLSKGWFDAECWLDDTRESLLESRREAAEREEA